MLALRLRPMRCLAPLVALVAVAPAQAQAAADAPFDLLRAAYGAVLAEPARAFTFAVTWEAPDTSVTETGRGLASVDLETGRPQFRLDFDEGEVSRVSLDLNAYTVEFPRTRRVYVDSTFQEIGEGTAAVLLLHPVLGLGLDRLLQDADPAVVAGADAVDGRPCTRATYGVPFGDGDGFVSVCYDAETALPSEIHMEAEADEGGAIVVRLASLEAVGAPPADAFTLDLRDGYERVPYDGSTEPLLEVGSAAPAFTLAGEAGASLADYRGRYVLVDFWGTWCAPCVEAIPHLQEITESYPDLVVLGLAAHEYEDDDPAGFVRQRGGTYRVLRADDATVEAYRVRAFPTYYVVDPAGTVVFVGVPDRDPDAEAALDAFLASTFRD